MQASPFRRHIGIDHAFPYPARYFATPGLALCYAPERSEAERETAAHEGWILGVLNSTAAALTAPAPPVRATPRPRC